MKKILILSVLLLLAGAGCAVKSGEQTLSAPLDSYQIEIIKSEANKNTFTVQAKNPTSMKELLGSPTVNSKQELRNGKEVVTSLDGVITTASKNWQLYLNNTKIDFIGLEQVTVKPTDKIEWRYEAN